MESQFDLRWVRIWDLKDSSSKTDATSSYLSFVYIPNSTQKMLTGQMSP